MPAKVEATFKDYIRRGYDPAVALAMAHDEERRRLIEAAKPVETYVPYENTVQEVEEEKDDEIEIEETDWVPVKSTDETLTDPHDQEAGPRVEIDLAAVAQDEYDVSNGTGEGADAPEEEPAPAPKRRGRPPKPKTETVDE